MSAALADAATAGTVAAEIEMSRLNWLGSFLVVEGPSDSRFWRTRKNKQCEIVIARGRPMVVSALEILNDREFKGALGIVDDDFDTLLSRELTVPNVVSTDARDLEGILLRSSALDKVLAEFGIPAKIDAFLSTEPPTIRDALLRRAELFGQIRWLNEISDVPVCVDALKPQRFCHVETWTYSRTEILVEAVRLGLAGSVDSIEEKLAQLPTVDPWHICRGHDLVDILTGGLINVLGSGEAKRPTVELLLRAGIEVQEFQATQLNARVRAWETANSPYLVHA